MRKVVATHSHDDVFSNKKLQASLEGKKVLIWSSEHGEYWRSSGAGYTISAQEAGVYTFEDAYKRTADFSAQKKIIFAVVEDGR